MSIGEYTLDTHEFNLGNKMYSPMNSVEFASWLQQEMNKRGLSNSELARRAGVTRGAIGNVLRGDRNVGSELCLAIAKGLKIPADVIFQKAGLLPSNSTDDDPLAREVDFLLTQMTPAQRESALKFMRFLANEGTAAPRPGDLAEVKPIT